VPDGEDYNDGEHDAEIEKARKNVLDRIEEGKEKANNYCSNNGYDAMIITNLSKTANIFKEYVLIRDEEAEGIQFEDYVFNWACVDGITPEDEQFSEYRMERDKDKSKEVYNYTYEEILKDIDKYREELNNYYKKKQSNKK